MFYVNFNVCYLFLFFICTKEIYQNVRKGGNIKNPNTGSLLEMDIWIPDFNLCLEFQVCILLISFPLIMFFFVRMITTLKVLGTTKTHLDQFKTEIISFLY